MPSPRSPDRFDPLNGFTPILLANLLPLGGVLWLGWEPAALVFIYGVEILLTLLLAGGKALFAQRPPPSDREGVITVSEADLTAKRGRFRLIDWLPPIYSRNVPFAFSVAGGLVMYGLFFGMVLSTFVEDAAWLTRPDVLLAIVGLVVGQLAETKRHYFDRRVYERVSPYAVVETPARQFFVLVFAMLWLGSALGSTGALAVVVCLKLVAEWATFHEAHTDESASGRLLARIAGWFAGPTESTGSAEPVDVPETTPDERLCPARNAVLLEGVGLTVARLAPFLAFFGVAWIVVVLAITSWLDSGLVVWLGIVASVLLLALVVGLQVATHYLEYGTLEYQRRGDQLVAYDRLLEAPQWTESVYRLRNVTVVSDRLTDRLLGTRTIRVTTGIRSTETERRLGPVAEPDRLVDAFELPVATTDFEPISRPLAISAAFLTVVILGSVAIFLVAPGLETTARINAVIYAPFCMLVPAGLWKLACR